MEARGGEDRRRKVRLKRHDVRRRTETLTIFFCYSQYKRKHTDLPMK